MKNLELPLYEFYLGFQCADFSRSVSKPIRVLPCRLYFCLYVHFDQGMCDRTESSEYQPSGEMIPNTFIEHAATSQSISLRTGCMCNPGGAAALLGVQDDMGRLYPGVTLKDFEHIVGRELGVVRISLGLASNFQDVWKVIRFVATIGNEQSRQVLWDRWMDKSEIPQTI